MAQNTLQKISTLANLHIDFFRIFAATFLAIIFINIK